jgi:hypothetical protein
MTGKSDAEKPRMDLQDKIDRAAFKIMDKQRNLPVGDIIKSLAVQDVIDNLDGCDGREKAEALSILQEAPGGMTLLVWRVLVRAAVERHGT